MDSRQRTVAKEISCTGIGLHSGKNVCVTIKPAPADSGIIFERLDTSDACKIRASFDNVTHTNMATTIGMNGYRISTVEHLMAAFFGMGIDNALVQIDGEEVPIMDGSSAPFVDLLDSAGVALQEGYKRFLLVKKPVMVIDGNRSVQLHPSDELRITYRIDFDHPLIKDQSYDMAFSKSAFIREISRARTFGFLRDVQTLWDNGLAKGGSLENAIVVDETRVLNDDGLRYKNEFVRHKLLDFIGDLAILGVTVIGHFVVERSGHSFNQELLKAFMTHENCWEELQLKNNEDYGKRNVRIPSLGFLGFAPA
ncbi:MAG: UDP-3-O-[3-hydroxymyristoyl] N-acetylglucosamine deacetylase [Deltaproteobacteria bacterium]|nr:UDP-3-O-acyl-N-acetylglucosamine deacetylase [Deltaproteobacteria bacterium]MBW2076195.1 UDP-3-O-acyl-N-acetylglucosamine deacetylase [Deltaproteobacteria bacterium]MBW2312315.1 UDP-3-O-acyl-N-acetylglucosamine deacetylase [Deltaproteobacteria bacterium]RLB29667.1 MAG: UDP-3-O-[3-hydroxymyristoyl] N-acetylglucosamine deacetylase [Deltaproteobacteria bacterium]